MSSPTNSSVVSTNGIPSSSEKCESLFQNSQVEVGSSQKSSMTDDTKKSTGSMDVAETPTAKLQHNHANGETVNRKTSTGYHHQGYWNAELIKDPAENPRVKISIDLPWLELSNTPRPAGTLTHVVDMEPPLNQQHSRKTRFEEDRRVNTDPYTHRSIVYRGVGARPSLDVLDADVEDQNLTSESYIAAMTDMDKMLESKVDWNRVEQLENMVWMAQSDPKCPNFIRQGSVSSYMRILKSALNKCKETLEVMKMQADDYYKTNETTITGIQLQKFAHFRLLADDTANELNLVEKNLNNPHLFMMNVTAMDKEPEQRKRYPMITPTRVRERYAKQVRVITEMLTLLEELFESAKRDEAENTVKLFGSGA